MTTLLKESLQKDHYLEEESDDDFYDAVSHMSSATNKRDSIGTFHSVIDAGSRIDLDDEVFDSHTDASQTEIAALILVVHSGQNLGYPSTSKDDIGVFRSTVNTVFKTQFPSVNSDVIEIVDIPLTIENESVQNLVRNCSVPCSGGSSRTSALWPIIASQDQHWRDTINTLRLKIETRYKIFLRKRPRFSGQVYLIGDVIGGLACFDYLTGNGTTDKANPEEIDRRKASTVSSPACERASWNSSSYSINRRSPSSRSQR